MIRIWIIYKSFAKIQKKKKIFILKIKKLITN